MPKPSPTEDDLKTRRELAVQMVEFMRDNKFTEVKLADLLGVSRRTVQSMKAAQVTAHPVTIRRLEIIFQKYSGKKQSKIPK